MLSVDSSLWQVRAYGDSLLHITQRSTGTIRTVKREALPSADEVAMMHELRFNRLCREAFHQA